MGDASESGGTGESASSQSQMNSSSSNVAAQAIAADSIILNHVHRDCEVDRLASSSFGDVDLVANVTTTADTADLGAKLCCGDDVVVKFFSFKGVISFLFVLYDRAGVKVRTGIQTC